MISHFWNTYTNKVNASEMVMRDDTFDYLKKYSWPGNIRELKFTLKRAIYSALGEREICPKHLPIWVTRNDSQCMNLYQMERQQILKVLDITRGNKEEAATILGISMATLYRKLNEYKSAKNHENKV